MAHHAPAPEAPMLSGSSMEPLKQESPHLKKCPGSVPEPITGQLLKIVRGAVRGFSLGYGFKVVLALAYSLLKGRIPKKVIKINKKFSRETLTNLLAGFYHQGLY